MTIHRLLAHTGPMPRAMLRLLLSFRPQRIHTRAGLPVPVFRPACTGVAGTRPSGGTSCGKSKSGTSPFLSTMSGTFRTGSHGRISPHTFAGL